MYALGNDIYYYCRYCIIYGYNKRSAYIIRNYVYKRPNIIMSISALLRTIDEGAEIYDEC